MNRKAGGYTILYNVWDAWVQLCVISCDITEGSTRNSGFEDYLVCHSIQGLG